jgi:hypothetical protein
VEIALVGVLVVHHEQPARAAPRTARKREVVHSVVVHADLLRLLLGRVRARSERGVAAEDRRAPGDERASAVSRRNGDLVAETEGDRGEAEQLAGLGGRLSVAA